MPSKNNKRIAAAQKSAAKAAALAGEQPAPREDDLPVLRTLTTAPITIGSLEPSLPLEDFPALGGQNTASTHNSFTFPVWGARSGREKLVSAPDGSSGDSINATSQYAPSEPSPALVGSAGVSIVTDAATVPALGGQSNDSQNVPIVPLNAHDDCNDFPDPDGRIHSKLEQLPLEEFPTLGDSTSLPDVPAVPTVPAIESEDFPSLGGPMNASASIAPINLSSEEFPTLGGSTSLPDVPTVPTVPTVPAVPAIGSDDFPALSGSIPKSLLPEEFPTLGGFPSMEAPQPVLKGVWGVRMGGAVPIVDTPAPPPPPPPEIHWEPVEESEEILAYTPANQLPPLVQNDRIDVFANSFAISLTPVEVFRYDVRIAKKLDKFERETVLAGGSRKKQADLGRILRIALEVFGLKTIYKAYDGASGLFTPTCLECPLETRIASTRLPQDLAHQSFGDSQGYFSICITSNSVGSLLTTDIFNEGLEDMRPGDKSVTSLLHLVLSQEAKDMGFLVTEGGSQLFDKHRAREVDKGIEELEGVGASIKIAEGASRNGQIQLVLDNKKTRFFKEGPLMNLKLQFGNRLEHDNIRSYLRHLSVGTVYSGQSFFIEDISKEPIRTIERTVEENGRTFTKSALVSGAEMAKRPVSEYHGEWPAVQVTLIRKQEKIKYAFPIENLRVMPGQKLATRHLGSVCSSATPPADRWESSIRVATQARLLSENRTLEAFGIRIDTKPIRLVAVKIPMPIIVYGRGATTSPDLSKKATWEPVAFKSGSGGFAEPGRISKIFIAYNSKKEQKDARGEEKVRDFTENLKKYGAMMNMAIGEIQVEDLGRTYPDVDAKDAIMKRLESLNQSSGSRPIFVYADISSCPTHEFLKLGERMFQVPTVQVCLDKSLEKQKKGTMINVIAKLNLRAMGLNHRVKPDNSITHLFGDATSTLIISYDVCHSSGKKMYSKGEICHEPSVVGFAFNGAKNPEAIIGDFHFQLPRKERVDDDILRRKARTIVEMYTRYRSKLPTRVVIIRDGVSDGQFGMVVNNELRAIQQGIRVFLSGRRVTREPAYALLIATKRHANKLFMKNALGKIDNVPPLAAIDHTIVHQNGNETIFLSHCPLTGTTQPIVLNLLVNQGVFRKKEEVVRLMAALCCSHQSSASIISLPETVYAADEYAKRGADIFSAYKEYLKRRGLPEDRVDGRWDFEAVTRKLCYENTIFRCRRIT